MAVEGRFLSALVGGLCRRIRSKRDRLGAVEPEECCSRESLALALRVLGVGLAERAPSVVEELIGVGACRLFCRLCSLDCRITGGISSRPEAGRDGNGELMLVVFGESSLLWV